MYNGMSFTAEEQGKLDPIISKFDEFTIGEINETYERYVFNSRNQRDNESIDAYVATLRIIARTCNFCDCLRYSLIRDRVVFGVKSAQKKKLQQERKLNLNKCIDLCRSTEATTSQLKMIPRPTVEEDINRVHKRPPKSQFRHAKNSKNDTPQIQCRFCACKHPQCKEKCPTWGKECLDCGGKSHLQELAEKPKVERIDNTSQAKGQEQECVDL